MMILLIKRETIKKRLRKGIIMEKWKKSLIVILVLLMFFSTSNLNVFAHDRTKTSLSTESEYKIYPIPQSAIYDGEEFTMSEYVNIVYETQIDQYTKSFLEELLSKYNRNYVVSNEIKDGMTNILLGVKDSNQIADNYLDNNIIIQDKQLYSRINPYVLVTDNDVITIVGKDTDCTFYGIATLQMMFSSFNGDKFLNVQIEDYAMMEYRGFIEGFYGGWNYQERESLMRFARDIKMNNYVYASKTDLYHTDKWNEKYPPEEIEKIKHLVEVGKETKCYYAWSVHISGFFRGLDTSNNQAYELRYNQLIEKFSQLYDLGVRKFDILNDDFGAGTNEDVVTLLNRLTTEFIKPKDCEPLTYCPQGYNKAWSGNGNELEALKSLDQSIIIYWTGDDVNSPITQETVNYVKEKTGHDACFWLNYPVNEHAKSGIFLGDISHYARSDVIGLKGAVSNPSRFAQSNKVGLFQLASLFWNSTDYQDKVQTIWQDSFRYLQPEVQDEYYLIASNIANCPGSSRVPNGFLESEYLKTALDSILKKVNAGNLLKNDEEVYYLINEFEAIIEAVKGFKEKCENQDLIRELNPWLNSLNDIAISGKAVLNSILAIQDNQIDEAWQQFSVAGKKLQTWDGYSTIEGEVNKAKAGSKRIQPFVYKLVTYAKNNLTPLFDSNNIDFIPSFYSVLGGIRQVDNDQSEKIFDGDQSTFGQWNIVQKVNDYYGIDMGKVIPIENITIIQGKNDNDHDYFHKAVLEYSINGVDFTQLGEQYDDTIKIEKDSLDIKARYIRLRLVETGTANKPDYWTHIREFSVNQKEVVKERIYTNIESLKQTPLTVSKKEFSIRNIQDLILKPNEYVGIKMMGLSIGSDIEFINIGFDNLTLQVSCNGIEWENVNDFTDSKVFKYLRVINLTNKDISGQINKLAATISNLQINPTISDTNLKNDLKEGKWENLFDGNYSSYIWTNEAQKENDYIMIDLGVTTALYDVKIVTEDGNPRLYNAKIEMSVDKQNWTTIATVENDNSIFEVPYRYVEGNGNGEDARYIRILITGNSGYYLKLCEVEINKNISQNNDTTNIVSSLDGNVNNCIDNDISTVFTVDKPTVNNDYVEYQLIENTKLKNFTILQDGQNIVLAKVKVRTIDGYKEVGIFDKAAKKFDVSDLKQNILAIRIEWQAGQLPAIYEIFTETDGKDTDDIGEYVEHIILEDVDELTNIAYLKEVVVSGTSDGQKENVTDGSDAKWDSNFIKGPNASENAWVYVDLGDNVNIINEITMKYFNKVYPTKYHIQISNDHENWITVESLEKPHNGPTYPIDNVKFQTPVTARYVRLLFEELNSVAAGNGVGLKELEIIGKHNNNYQIHSVKQLDDLKVEINTPGDQLDLPKLINISVFDAMQNEQFIQVPVIWDLTRYKDDVDGICNLKGILDINSNINNPNNYGASINIIVGKGEAEVDKSVLETILADVKRIDLSIYTNDSVKILKQVYDNADKVYHKEEVKQNEIDEQIELLHVAINNLLLKVTVKVENLALNKNVTVSGTSDGKADNLVDGDMQTKWDSNFIKGPNASENAWVIIDLDQGTSLIEQIKISYHNLVYPTKYDILVSNDKENWTCINTIEKEHNSPTYPVDTISFDQLVACRYLKLNFKELNNVAIGNGVGIKEIEVMGRKINEEAVVWNIPEVFEIVVDKGINIEDLKTMLPKVILVEVAVKGSLSYQSDNLFMVLMPVEWDLDEFSDSEKVILIDGNIEGMGLINNYNNLKACLKIIINDDHINITNKEQLKELLDKADRIKDLDQYTIESKERFLEALMQAKIIYNDESSSQIMIDKARAVLNEAINSLEKKVIIKDNLERLISEVEGLNGLDYTDVSWEFLSEVLKKAKIIFNQIDCSQEEIDNCCIELEDAINRLVKKKVDIIVSKNPNSVNTGDSNIEKEYFALLAISCLGIIIKKRKD